MKIGKYLYISGIIRHIYHLDAGKLGDFVKKLFWIHPSTTVIHPSNRGIFAYLNKSEALEINKILPKLIVDIELYKKNKIEIMRYHKYSSMIKKKNITLIRRNKLQKYINEFKKKSLYQIVLKLEKKKIRDISSTFYSTKEYIKLFPKIWEAFMYAKFYTKSYIFNGRVLSYREVTYLNHSYSDCVETFFRNICIIANYRPNNFKNLKEDTYQDHLLWIQYLLTVPNLEYNQYPEIKSSEKNLNIFLKFHNLNLAQIGFHKINSTWILKKDWFTVEAYLIASHASVKTIYLQLEKKLLPLRYSIYLKPHPKIFLTTNEIKRAINFIVFYKEDKFQFQFIYKFLINNYLILEKKLNLKEKKICFVLLQKELQLLGENYMSKAYPNEFQLIKAASKLFEK